MLDDTAGSPELPETGIENSSKNIENNTKTTQNSAEKAFFDAKKPPKHSKTSPEVENSLKLLLDCDSIIRASTKIEKSAPHIYERCTKSDGKSISSALSVSYRHKDHPNDVFMYKRSDIKYDIQRGWIYLVSPVSSASGGVELELDSTDAENSENPSPAPSEPQTPLSGAPTPYRVMPSTSNATPNRPSRSASKTASSSRIRSSFSATGRPVMPSCLEDNDSISSSKTALK
mgnify:CR=1 FL=1